MSYCTGCGNRTAKREVAGDNKNVIIVITCPECDRVVIVKYGKEVKKNVSTASQFNPPHKRKEGNVDGDKRNTDNRN